MTRTEALAKMLDHGRGYQMSPAERHAQRVSMVFGLRSNKSNLTRRDVEEVLGDASTTASVVKATEKR